jgi:hypothetical protein
MYGISQDITRILQGYLSSEMVGYGEISSEIFGDLGYLLSTYPEKDTLIRYPRIS